MFGPIRHMLVDHLDQVSEKRKLIPESEKGVRSIFHDKITASCLERSG